MTATMTDDQIADAVVTYLDAMVDGDQTKALAIMGAIPATRDHRFAIACAFAITVIEAMFPTISAGSTISTRAYRVDGADTGDHLDMASAFLAAIGNDDATGALILLDQVTAAAQIEVMAVLACWAITAHRGRTGSAP